MQGALTDPGYFDFISSMQLTTASRLMKDGAQTFKEYCEDCEGGSRMVTRDAILQDNSLLPNIFEVRLGDAIYAGLRNGFQGTQFAAPSPLDSHSTFVDIVSGARQLLKTFLDVGYALRGDISLVDPASQTFKVRLEGYATAWGMQSAASRLSRLYPAYDALALAAFVRTSGRRTRCSLSWTNASLEEEWTIL